MSIGHEGQGHSLNIQACMLKNTRMQRDNGRDMVPPRQWEGHGPPRRGSTVPTGNRGRQCSNTFPHSGVCPTVFDSKGQVAIKRKRHPGNVGQFKRTALPHPTYTFERVDRPQRRSRHWLSSVRCVTQFLVPENASSRLTCLFHSS